MSLIWCTFKVLVMFASCVWGISMHLGVSAFCCKIFKDKAIVLACEHIFALAKMEPQFPFKRIDTHFMEIDASAMYIHVKTNELWKNDAKMQLLASIFECVCKSARVHEQRQQGCYEAFMVGIDKCTHSKVWPKNVQNLIMRKHDHVHVFCFVSALFSAVLLVLWLIFTYFCGFRCINL